MKKIYLIDCPGVVYPTEEESDEEKVLKGVVRTELVEDPTEYVAAVLNIIKPEHIRKHYLVDSWTDANDFLEKVKGTTLAMHGRLE